MDNSEYMRNGDYTPTRMEAQNDAVTFLFNAKTQSNPENTVGLMTCAGKGPEVFVTLTSDIGKVLTALHTISLGGKANFTTGVNIAQLALKHRQNKNQRQRIIVFVGSPIDEDDKTLVKLGKKLKKNNVAVDVINFGEEALNTEKLEAFLSSVNNSDNSHLVTIPPGPHILTDVLISSPIVAGEDGAPPGFASGAGFEFGVDPSLDPELALALRISMEEEKARQEAVNKGSSETGGSSSSAMATDAPKSASAIEGDEDVMLAKALAMSMGKTEDDDVKMTDLTEEDQIARAIELSMSAGGTAESTSNAATLDPSFMNSVLGSLPGVDPNDPRIKSAIAKQKEEEDKKKEK